MFFQKEKPQASAREDVSALVDETKVILAVSRYFPILPLLASCVSDTFIVRNIAMPNYPNGLPFNIDNEPAYHKWSWDGQNKRLIYETPKANLTPSIAEKSRLAIRKGKLFEIVIRTISAERSSVSCGAYLQETIYIMKRIQAEKFIDLGYPEKRLLEFPYLLRYAGDKGVSGKVAADEIILQSRLADSHLAKTESLRIKYFSLIKNAARESDLPYIRKQFLLELTPNFFPDDQAKQDLWDMK